MEEKGGEDAEDEVMVQGVGLEEGVRRHTRAEMALGEAQGLQQGPLTDWRREMREEIRACFWEMKEKECVVQTPKEIDADDVIFESERVADII